MLSIFLPSLFALLIFSVYLFTYQPIYKYSPSTCTITNYKFTFIFDGSEQRFKVHGIWPDGCKECPECSYPSCCNLQNVVYTDPYDPTNFIGTNWFTTQTSDGCAISQNKVTLFEHEYYKHISCTNLKSTTDFLNLAITLYDKYYDKYVTSNCNGSDEIWLDLDNNFGYQGFECH